MSIRSRLRPSGARPRVVPAALLVVGASAVAGLGLGVRPAAAAPDTLPAKVVQVASEMLASASASANAPADRGAARLLSMTRVAETPAQTAALALVALADGDGAAYSSLVVGLAGQIGPAIEVEPDTLADVWLATDGRRMTAVLSALSQLGVKYRYAAAEPGVAFDCSGLTSWAWAQAGVTIAHQSRRQITAAAPVDPDQARPGDLLYYPGHVMLALGVDQAVVHAVSRGKPVEVQGRPDRVRRSLRAGAVVDD